MIIEVFEAYRTKMICVIRDDKGNVIEKNFI